MALMMFLAAVHDVSPRLQIVSTAALISGERLE
jgi:hypothetical protein